MACISLYLVVMQKKLKSEGKNYKIKKMWRLLLLLAIYSVKAIMNFELYCCYNYCVQCSAENMLQKISVLLVLYVVGVRK